MVKSEVKRRIKEGVKKKMEVGIAAAKEGSTNMRFLKTIKFEQAPYFERYGGEDANIILKTRLNMIDIYGNYKGDITKEWMCIHCKEHLDTTEHLVQCPRVSLSEERGVSEGVLYDCNSDGWKDVVRVVETNLSSR